MIREMIRGIGCLMGMDGDSEQRAGSFLSYVIFYHVLLTEMISVERVQDTLPAPWIAQD
jgi:hypothetical protein